MDKYILAFLKCKGVGNVKLLKYLMKYRFNVEKMLDNKLEIIGNVDPEEFDELVKLSEKELFINAQKGIKIITILDKNYPIKLYNIKDPILYLYYIGNLDLLYNTSIAVIGSREIDEKEKNLTIKISNYISSNGVTVVSGLALGTDTCAHIGSYRENGHTIAILPSGLDIITPSSNKDLAKEIVKYKGLLVSEYSCGTSVTKYTYVKRDRIQAALADAIVVIKASEKSGTMHAVKIAQAENKYVTQYEKNSNNLICNTFEKKEDINKIIEISRNVNYKINDDNKYKQESLFEL